MSLRSGSHGLAHLGIPDDDPRLICDWCGMALYARAGAGGPPRWLLSGKPPKGWRGGLREDGTRLDMCPGCARSPRLAAAMTIIGASSQRGWSAKRRR